MGHGGRYSFSLPGGRDGGLGEVGPWVGTTQLGPDPPFVQQYGGTPPNGHGLGVVGDGVDGDGKAQFGPVPPLVQQYGGTPPKGQGLGVIGVLGVEGDGSAQFGPDPPLVQQYGGTPP